MVNILSNIKILAIVVTYYPEIELLKSNIEHLLPYVNHLLIWENMPLNECSKQRIFNSPKVEYVGENKNVGISKALNFGWHYAVTKGYDYLLTMDQDSIFVNLDVFLFKIARSSKAKSAIFSPHQGTDTLDIPYRELDHCITSGMLVSVSVLNTIGGYSEAFFVDGIDLEFCYRARMFGFKTFEVSGCSLIQKYGSPCIRKFLWKKIVVSNYSPFRLYGILKNFKIISLIYKNEKGVRHELKSCYLRSFVRNIIFFESQKKEKLLAILSGYLHGKYFDRPLKVKLLDKIMPIYKS